MGPYTGNAELSKATGATRATDASFPHPYRFMGRIGRTGDDGDRTETVQGAGKA